MAGTQFCLRYSAWLSWICIRNPQKVKQYQNISNIFPTDSSSSGFPSKKNKKYLHRIKDFQQNSARKIPADLVHVATLPFKWGPGRSGRDPGGYLKLDVGKLLKNCLNIVILSGNWGLEWPARVESGWNEYCIGNWTPLSNDSLWHWLYYGYYPRGHDAWDAAPSLCRGRGRSRSIVQEHLHPECRAIVFAKLVNICLGWICFWIRLW